MVSITSLSSWQKLVTNQLHVDGHYLNLPVMNEGGEIVGMVDVLKLTYATLEQVRKQNIRCEARREQCLLTCLVDQFHVNSR